MTGQKKLTVSSGSGCQISRKPISCSSNPNPHHKVEEVVQRYSADDDDGSDEYSSRSNDYSKKSHGQSPSLAQQQQQPSQDNDDILEDASFNPSSRTSLQDANKSIREYSKTVAHATITDQTRSRAWTSCTTCNLYTNKCLIPRGATKIINTNNNATTCTTQQQARNRTAMKHHHYYSDSTKMAQLGGVQTKTGAILWPGGSKVACEKWLAGMPFSRRMRCEQQLCGMPCI